MAGTVALALLGGLAVTEPARADDKPVNILAEDPVTVFGADVLGCEDDVDSKPGAADRILSGTLQLSPFGPVAVRKDGNFNWAIDPFDHPSWASRYRSLRWVEPLIDESLNPERTPAERSRFREHAQAIIQDWVKDNPPNAKNKLRFIWDDPTAVALRSAFLLCAKRSLGGSAWLHRTIDDHAAFLRKHWSGAWNHGTMEALALYRIGCLESDREARRVGRSRLVGSFESKDNRFGPALDNQGATNEQAVGYAEFTYQLWHEVMRTFRTCGDTVPQVIRNRVAKAEAFVTAAIQPDGNLVQLGDTFARPAEVEPGTTIQYAATKGAKGPRPTKLVSVFKRGYVFGRSGWGTARPFAEESFYSLRFGPARQVHGHLDHTSMTYFARGVPMLVDSGHNGYKAGAQRSFLRSPAAHNVLEVAGVKARDVATTLTRQVLRKRWQSYTMTDQAFGFSRTRNVLVAQGPDIAIVHDSTGSADRTRTFRQLWHLAPTMDVSRGAKGVAKATPRGGVDARLWLIPVRLGGGGKTQVVTGRTRPRQGWVSEQVLQARKAPVVEMTSTGRSARMLTVIVPAAKSAKVTTSVKNLGKGAKLLTVRIDGKAYKFRVAAGGVLTRV
ncbi:hypothetical protein GCM10009547_40130 [Sporichthya brevicatena]|uniref:Heparinase II/III-like C-terminal domain-containing protein n=1 Tax=Sporichthya brevicatena TaxID=171442 RepID=A0ABN1H7X5_9ACTN